MPPYASKSASLGIRPMIRVGRILSAMTLAFASWMGALPTGDHRPGLPLAFAGTADMSPYDFHLLDSSGRSVSTATYKGKWLLVYFGFTSCPDICPTTMNDVSDALSSLGDAAARVQPIFITVDPERDTPEALKAYLSNFDSRIVGLSGSLKDIQAVANGYQFPFHKRATPDGGYAVEHSDAMHVISPSGEYAGILFPSSASNSLANGLREIMGRTQHEK